MSRIRCFVAVGLPSDLAENLSGLQAVISAADPRWTSEKWVAHDNLHLTLKFLGDVSEGAIESLGVSLGSAVQTLAPFELGGAGLVAVPGDSRARMLWAALPDPDGACRAVARAVDEVAGAFGVTPDTRPFVPHVTLCRCRSPHGLLPDAREAAEERIARGPEKMSVPAVSLFSSRLTPRGPIYREIGAWPLGGVSPRRAESARGAAGRR